MSGSRETRFAEESPRYNAEDHCHCSAFGRSSGEWNRICRSAFGDEWDHADDYHGHECEDMRGPFAKCYDPGTPKCVHSRYTSDSNPEVHKQCCLYGKSGQEPYVTCNPNTKDSTECNEDFKKFCSQEINFFSDKCKTWLKRA